MYDQLNTELLEAQGKTVYTETFPTISLSRRREQLQKNESNKIFVGLQQSCGGSLSIWLLTHWSDSTPACLVTDLTSDKTHSLRGVHVAVLVHRRCPQNSKYRSSNTVCTVPPYVLANEKKPHQLRQPRPLLRNWRFLVCHPILSTTKTKPWLIQHLAVLGKNSRWLYFHLPSLNQGLTNRIVVVQHAWHWQSTQTFLDFALP